MSTMINKKLKNGKHIDLYEDGSAQLECNYEDGKLDGKWVQWHKNGTLAAEGNYKNNKPVGSWLHHVYEDKNLHPNRKDGSMRYWKFIVNAGVRYGEILDPDNSGVATLEFNSVFVDSQSHRKIYEGQVTINNKAFGNTRCVFEGKQLITYHPIVHDPEAYKNKLGGLVDYLMYSGRTIDKKRLTTFYHRCYQDNPLITAGELIERDLSDQAIKMMNNQEDEITAKVRDSLYIEIRNDILADLEKSNTSDTNEISEEIKTRILDVESDRKLQEYEKINVEKSGSNSVNIVKESNILINVDSIKYNGYVENIGNLCIRLTFDDGKHKYMKISTWDNSGEIREKAKTLIGKRIRTTCWDPVGTSKWSNLDYFKNIYQV